jgi:Cdc6-like AAA superfamily ATPase
VKDSNGKVQVMHRKITDELLNFILKNQSEGKRAVYVHGLQGVGKSHSLYEIVSELRGDEHNRVVYVPDCGGWGNTAGEDTLEFLLTAIVTAFPNDEQVLDYCNSSVEFTENSFAKLLDFIPEYCKTKQF